MYKHIGVGLDGSNYGATAEQFALALAGRLDAAVHGIHVVDASFVEGAFITDISSTCRRRCGTRSTTWAS